MTTSFVELFKDEPSQTRSVSPSSAAVSPATRDLAQEDLYRALLKSNANLSREGDLDRRLLKGKDELRLMAVTTEESIFDEHAYDLQKYTETVYTYLAFLLDESLSNDAVLFRVLLNMDIDDLYKNKATTQLIFSELFYAPCETKDKYKCLLDVLTQIEQGVRHLRDRYEKGQQFTRRINLNYSIPTKVRRAMTKFQNEQLDNLLDKLLSYERVNPDEYMSDVGSSGIEGSVVSLNDMFVSEDEVDVQSDAEASSEVDVEEQSDAEASSEVDVQSDVDAVSEVDVQSDAEAVSEEQSDAQSAAAPSVVSRSGGRDDESMDLQSLIQTIQSINRNSPSPQLSVPSSTPQETVSSPSPALLHPSGQLTVPTECAQCNVKVASSSYRTPLLNQHRPEARVFCGWKCMEKWSP